MTCTHACYVDINRKLSVDILYHDPFDLALLSYPQIQREKWREIQIHICVVA